MPPHGAFFTESFALVPDLSDGVISNNAKFSTDHVSFDAVGLPGFQFIQDPLDYFTRLHHTHVDSFDHAIPEDMKQAAVVLATLVYNAAHRRGAAAAQASAHRSDVRRKGDRAGRSRQAPADAGAQGAERVAGGAALGSAGGAAQDWRLGRRSGACTMGRLQPAPT